MLSLMKKEMKQLKGDELLMELNNTIKDYCHNGNEMFLNDLYWQERIQRCEGRKEGIIQGKFEIAKKMLLETSDLSYISRMTDLSIEEITKLQKENTTEMQYQTVDKRNFVNGLFILEEMYYNKYVRCLMYPNFKLTTLLFLCRNGII